MPRVFNLGTDISNSDSLRWHRRSENFLTAIKTGEVENTYQRYHPGVTLMWISSFSSILLTLFQQISGSGVITMGNSDFYPLYHGFSKLIIVIFLLLLLVIQMSLIKRIASAKCALIYGFFISLEPYFIGINRWFHLTSLEAMFSMVSLLYLFYYFKNKKLRYLMLSALFIGLGVLTKMTVFVAVFFELLVILFALVKKNITVKSVSLYFLVLVAIIFILFPALWVSPADVLNRMQLSLFSAVADDPHSQHLSSLQNIFFYVITMVIKMSPLTVLLSLIGLKNLIKNKNTLAVYFLLYFLVLFIALTISDQKIDRYVVALFPPLFIIISFYLSKVSVRRLIIVLFLHFILFGYAVYCFNPVYSSYISPVVPYRSILYSHLYDNSGEYFSQTALYLNTKGRDKKVLVPNNVESFSPYYKGTIVTDIVNADYVVYSLDFDRTSFPFIDRCKIEKYFGNKIYDPVAIYRCELNALSFAE